MTHIIAIAGGKGGTGKTFIAVNITYIIGNENEKILLIDADVENPSVPSVINISFTKIIESKSFKPVINEKKCNKCGLCVKNCPEHALTLLPTGKLLYLDTLCASCGVCQLICPTGAIGSGEKVEGLFKYGVLNDNIDIIVGELIPGNRRSAALIVRLIENHKDLFKKYKYIIVDSPPGSGVGLYSILKYATHIVAVTEPTPLGVNDLKKFLTLIDKYEWYNKKVLVVINKYGIPSNSYSDLEQIIKERGLLYVKIPYSKLVLKTYLLREPFVKLYSQTEVAEGLRRIVDFVK